jgi:NADH-quinone oxidoreductase subunit J
MSTGQVILATLVILLGAGGSYLLLPHRHGATRSRTVHAAGAVLASLALLGFLTFFSPPSPFLAGLFFYLFSIGAIVGGLLTVTSRNPIYSALWFASVVLSTAGLFLLAGAQFLAAGTVIVYAGAIIVTFLFVIMLADGRESLVRPRRPGPGERHAHLLPAVLVPALHSGSAFSPAGHCGLHGQRPGAR